MMLDLMWDLTLDLMLGWLSAKEHWLVKENLWIREKALGKKREKAKHKEV